MLLQLRSVGLSTLKSYFKAPCIQTSCGVFFFRIKTTSKTYPESKGGLNLKGELAHSYCRKCLSSFLYKYSLAEFVLKMQKNPAEQNCQGKRKTALDTVEFQFVDTTNCKLLKSVLQGK